MAKLPHFQRIEAWDRSPVADSVNTVVQNLSLGVTLVLKVGNQEQFISRYSATASDFGSRGAEHIPDGQQRPKDFLHAVHNNHEGGTCHVYLPEFAPHTDDCIEYMEVDVHCQLGMAKDSKVGLHYPVSAAKPARWQEHASASRTCSNLVRILHVSTSGPLAPLAEQSLLGTYSKC